MNREGQELALVVDDDAIILMHACDILEEAGFKPLEAHCAGSAIERLEAEQGEVALLFTDVDLGDGRDGFELAAEVATRWPEIGILVASGARTPTPEQMPAGATFVRKPFSASVVHGHLHEILSEERKPAPLKELAGQ